MYFCIFVFYYIHVAREGEHKDREGAESGGISGVELDLRAIPSSLHDEKNDDVGNAGKHEGAEVLEGIELLCVGEGPYDDGDHEDPEPSLCGHSDVPLLVALRHRGLRVVHILIKVGPAHDGEGICDNDEVRDQHTDKVNEQHDVEKCSEGRGDLISDPREAHVDVGELAVVLLLLSLVELVAHVRQEPHAEEAEGAHKKHEDDADDETELVHGHGKTEDTGTHNGVHEGDLTGQDGGHLLDLGELAVVLEGWGTVDLDDIVVFLKGVIGSGHVLGHSLEFDALGGTGADHGTFVNAEPFGHFLALFL